MGRDADEVEERGDRRDFGAEISRTFAEMLDSLAQMRERGGGWPGASSPAMAELRFEAELAAPLPWGDEPVPAARNLAIALTVAAGDHARAFADAVARYAPYASAVSARAAAEACGQMAWICEAGIGARERVRRSVNERLRSFTDERKALQRVPELVERVQEVTDSIDSLRATAESLGYRLNKLYLDPDPGGMTELVAAMFDEHVGGLMYHLMSSTAHGRVSRRGHGRMEPMLVGCGGGRRYSPAAVRASSDDLNARQHLASPVSSVGHCFDSLGR